MITEKNHKLLTSQLFVTDCTKKGLASMHLYTLYIINRKLEFSNSKTKVKVSPINGMSFPIGLVYINNDLKKIIIYTLYFNDLCSSLCKQIDTFIFYVLS